MERKLSLKQRRRYSQLRLYENPHFLNEGQFFEEANTYPSFFDQNLLDDDRKIKLFRNDPHTHEIVFYFQLLKVIFQCEDSDFQKYLQKIYDIIQNPEFQMTALRPNHQYYVGMGNAKMKRVLTDFLQEMGNGQLSVQDGLKKYPIIRKILVIFLRSLLIIGEQCSEFDQIINPSDAYDLLANYFQLEITYYGNCLRFNQVDVFVYFQSENEVYLAYILPENSHQMLDSSQLYQNDPQEEFNISSVKQMVSEIDIKVDTDCFQSSKNNLEDTEEVDYNYSNSDVKVASRSLHEGSDLKFSYLINDDSLQNLNVVKSNKILEKQLIGMTEKKPAFKIPQMECYKIEQAPMELENATSPISTPRQAKLFCFGKDESQRFDKENIYGRSKKRSSNLKSTIQEQYQLLSTYKSEFKQEENFTCMNTAQSQSNFKNEAQYVLGDSSGKPAATLKSLYELKSIKSIGSESQSNLIWQTPYRGSKLASRAQTINNKYDQMKLESSETKNVSSEFTSSFILRQMQEPYQSNIRSMKTRARTSRTNIQKLMFF